MKTGMLIAPVVDSAEPQVFVLDRTTTAVGRDAACAIVIDDARVSRRHAVIQRRGGRYLVDDQDSRNGTRVNGVAIVHQRLRHRDRLSFGGVEFTFEEGDPPTDAPAPTGASDEAVLPDRGETVAHAGSRDGGGGGGVAALQAWRIVRACPRGPAAPLRAWLDDIAADLEGLSGVGHVLLFFPAGSVASGETFIRCGAREGRSYQEVVLREVATTQQPLGLTAGRRAPLSRSARHLDGLYAPIVLPSGQAGCLYVDADGGAELPDEIAGIALSVVEAIVLGLSFSGSGRDGVDAGASRGSPAEPDAGIVGQSRALLEVVRVARKAASSAYPVLVRGETGTGKELVSRLIYQESERSAAPYLPVHCSAIEENLLGSALFGHEKGAFTGAVSARKGFFEEADGGTIFLDEIGELTLAMQVKLLRVLQDGEFIRLGSSLPRKVSVRVIAATNRDLEAAIQTGAFREDLYYRLKVFELRLPALRERKDDIPDLVTHFVERVRRTSPTTVQRVAKEAMSALQQYRWPGNIRELQNVIERAMVLAEGEVLTVADLPADILGAAPDRTAGTPPTNPPTGTGEEPESLTLRDVEDRHILKVYERSDRNQAETARRLGISRSTLIERLKALQSG